MLQFSDLNSLSYGPANSSCPERFYVSTAATANARNSTTTLNCSGFSPTLAFVIQGTDNVLDVAQLNDQLFVIRLQTAVATQVVTIYNTTTFQQIGDIAISTNYLSGLTVDPINNFLYVSDEDYPVTVFVVNLSTLTKTSFTIAGGGDVGLSVNSAQNILAAAGIDIGTPTIQEYTRTGSLVREIPIANALLWQAVEVSSGTLAVSRFGPTNDVILLSVNGSVLRSYGSGQVNCPRGLAVDRNGFVLVADSGNNRILALDPTLSKGCDVASPLNGADPISYPSSLWMDESRGRLYVGGDNRVFVFDDFRSISAAFIP